MRARAAEVARRALGRSARPDGETVSEWFSSLNFQARQNDLYDQCCEGTGQWFIDREDYHLWRSSQGGILWINGPRAFLLDTFDDSNY